MIITKTPLRISFVGGGSDLPWFYAEEPGACVTAAIDKYVYVTYGPKYDNTYRVAYSQMETVAQISAIEHELVRHVLLGNRDEFNFKGCEIHSIADIPGGTGLGSSSSFTVGLLRAVRPQATLIDVVRAAIGVEVDGCHKMIGVQDQWTAVLGGINLLEFETHRAAKVSPLQCDYEALNDHCLLFDTGLRRTKDAGDILASQNHDRESLRALAALAHDFAAQLQLGDLIACAVTMDCGWQVKRKLLRDARIEAIYEAANRAGAWGGKLCGAGDGGFMLFMAPPEQHDAIKQALRLRHVPIKLGVEGARVIYSD